MIVQAITILELSVFRAATDKAVFLSFIIGLTMSDVELTGHRNACQIASDQEPMEKAALVRWSGLVTGYAYCFYMFGLFS
jgi:hypothetical protein